MTTYILVFVVLLPILFRKNILTAIYAGRIAGDLIDLGIDVNKLGRDERGILFEIEKTKRREMTHHEAAAYFFCAALPSLEPYCLLNGLSHREVATRALTICNSWVLLGKMHPSYQHAFIKSLLRSGMLSESTSVGEVSK